MKFLLVLILGIAIGGTAVWWYQSDHYKSSLQKASEHLEQAAKSAGAAIEEQLHSLHLTREEITNELAKTGRIIRSKAAEAGHAISSATADARITATVKAKLLADRDLSGWGISVSTTDGVVTLSGKVSSPEDIGKAVVLAMNADGVHKVISTIQVNVTK